MQFMPFIEQYHYWGTLGLLLLAGFGAPFPEDIVLVSSGFIAFKTQGSIIFTILICLLGVIVGDGIMFSLGRFFGEKLLNTAYFRRILVEEKRQKIQGMFQKYGSRIIFVARFMPGFRAPIFVVTGSMAVPLSTFMFWDGLAALLSVPALCYAGYFFGHMLPKIIEYARNFEGLFLVLVLILVLFFVVRSKMQSRKTLV